MIINLCAIWSILQSAPIANLFTVQVEFRIFYPENENYIQFTVDNYEHAYFDKSKNYVLLSHGWVDDFPADWYTSTVKELSSHRDTIVIQGGYHEAMNCKFYFGSVFLLNEIASKYSNLILHMVSLGISPQKIQIVGHSLGAHIAGIAGKYVLSETGVKLKTIFALDPPGPLIPRWNVNKHRRLTKNDASFVVVFHTSFLGTRSAIGHADFYPNGGVLQGKCGQVTSSAHEASTMYFFCSINERCRNFGYQCESYSEFLKGSCRRNNYALMGYNIDDSARGVFYLTVKC